ncbi:hypothetical protein FQZ97_900460 [compost metagenome]
MHALRALGPFGHGPFVVHEIDAVVLDCIDHEPVALLAQEQLGAAFAHALFQIAVGFEHELFGAAPLADVVQFDEDAFHAAVL